MHVFLIVTTATVAQLHKDCLKSQRDDEQTDGTRHHAKQTFPTGENDRNYFLTTATEQSPRTLQ